MGDTGRALPWKGLRKLHLSSGPDIFIPRNFWGIVLVGKITKLKEAQLKTEPWRVRSNA